MLRDSPASLRVAEAWGPTKRGSKSSAFARCYSDFGHYYHLLHYYVNMQHYKRHTGASLATCGITVSKKVVHHNLYPWKLGFVCVYSATQHTLTDLTLIDAETCVSIRAKLSCLRTLSHLSAPYSTVVSFSLRRVSFHATRLISQESMLLTSPTSYVHLTSAGRVQRMS